MAISAKQVKELRDKTGAGMMDCKKALGETNGDVEAAVDFLRQKGILKAAKKAGRATREGQIGAYIHPGSKIGVLVEINCETDFAARTEAFSDMVKNIAMQIAAASPICVRREELSEDVLERERNVYRAQALESGKPENVIDKIVDGKMRKYYEDACLLEQSYIRDSDKKVEDIIKETVAELGENIHVARFSRFQLGETAYVESESEEKE
ncbi:MAG: translation elongation factor Ts [Kiritimatiellaceae bacterium]|nr:translation elongation factor Ts [Kiritimatiellaceae bacterium]